MKLVITYYVTDGYTYGFDIVKCIEYESEEHFIEDFGNAYKKAKETNDYEFEVGNLTFEIFDFEEKKTLTYPQIEKLEDWFQGKTKE